MGKKKKSQTKEVVETTKAVIFSTVNHNITISYNGMSMVIPPRGKCNIDNHYLLGSMPKHGLILKKLK